MRLIPSDPDIQTLVTRIRNGDIDLQPDFQRGEVWGLAKQKRLIDSILRNWHVPPIHVVQNPDTGTQDVLDGQQRLAAIRDFVDGVFGVDGSIPPISAELQSLDGLRYSQLPQSFRRIFDQFTIRFFKIVDFEPDEPAELFFRLNQPVALTSAEQRNAFFGPIRTQVKKLVEHVNDTNIGFSNSRMAFDDVLARLCICIERGSIREKLTASGLADRYRSRQPFSEETMKSATDAVTTLNAAIADKSNPVRFNKATLFSWLWTASEAAPLFGEAASAVVHNALLLLEAARLLKLADLPDTLHFLGGIELRREIIALLTGLYSDRSSSRVSDVSSVLARDAVSWVFIGIAASSLSIAMPLEAEKILSLQQLLKRLSTMKEPTQIDFLERIIESASWEGRHEIG